MSARRGFFETVFFALIVRPGKIPRGAEAIPPAHPGAAPVLADVTRRLRAHAARYRALGASVDAAARDRVWIENPFMTRMRWHYTLPEAVRMQAIHVRHHAAQIAELPAASS